MKPAPSSESLSIGSSVWSNVGSPVLLLNSAITTVTGSCALTGGGVRVKYQGPVTSAMTPAAAAAISFLLNRAGTGIGLPSSSNAASAAASSSLVWNRLPGSGSRQRETIWSTSSVTSGTSVLTGG